ncbi:hypothetical protein D4764_18G0006730 [Takifugu flavidus]|uniref:Uncharacterized protein n=1 Tax=Takifugu flavidus TaxID=433684 RepID=A0A5C6NW25_9TELE|nr:hypothetical protein D4764_18G0006730 [Takifugu flavidus]
MSYLQRSFTDTLRHPPPPSAGTNASVLRLPLAMRSYL